MPLLCQHPIAAMLCAAALSLLAGTAGAAAPGVEANARSLDLGDRNTAQLADGLRQDLTILLKAAEYNSNKNASTAPRHSIITVPRIAAAIRAHHGVGYVVLGKRDNGGSGVTISNLYVLEGAPIAAASKSVSGGAESGLSETPEISRKVGVELDLSGDEESFLALQDHLGALPPAAAAATLAVEDVIKALLEQRQVAFVVLSERRGDSSVERSHVFVIPDVLRINITGASGPQVAPEVEITPARGGRSRIKFEFDPQKYNINKR